MYVTSNTPPPKVNVRTSLSPSTTNGVLSSSCSAVLFGLLATNSPKTRP